MSLSRDGPSKVKILLVDDQPANLLALKVILEGLDVALVEAYSGEEALRLLLEDEFAVVLLDALMPGLDGFETAKLIRAREETRRTPIIFVTAYDSDRATVEKAYQLGAVDFLVKPLMPIVLRAKVMEFVELFQHTQQIQTRAAELRTSEERFRLLVEGTKDYAIVMLDATGRIISWNPGAERIKQYQASEIVGQHFSQFYPQEAVERGWPDEELRRATAEGRFEDEGWRVRKDGSRFWASVVITALRDDGGNLRGFSKITRDLTERRQAEENARRLFQEETARGAAEQYARVIEGQREQLRVTLTSIGDAVITTDADGRVSLLNPVAERLTGWTNDGAAGQPLQSVLRIVNEVTGQTVANPVAKVIATSRIVGLANHTVLIAKDGTERPIDDSAAPIRNAHGEITGVVLVFRDVTERRRTEKALQESEERSRHLLEFHQAVMANMGEGLYAVDAQGLVTYMNPAAEAMFGWAFEELKGRRMHDLTHYKHPDGTPFPIEECAGFQVLHKGVALRNHEDVFIRKDGGFFPVVYSSSLLRSGDMTVGLVVVFRDITERKRVEEQLRENERRLAAEAAAMNRLHELVSRLLVCPDLGTALNEVLDATSTLMGSDRGNVQLLNPHSGLLEIVAHRGYQQAFLDHFRTVSSDDGSCCGRAMKARERVVIEDVQTDAGYEPHRAVVVREGLHGVQSTPLVGRDGALLGMLSTHFRHPHRPTERDLGILDLYVRQAADYIERMRADQALREADHRKDEFLATLAHELRNPLAPIRNAVELLKGANNDGKLVEQARTVMERQLVQMVRLIDDLLDISRISRGKLQLRKERVELASVVNTAVETSRPFIEASRHELTIALPPEPVHVDADPIRLAQVFANLLNNAAKYTEKGGRIWLTAERLDGEIAVSVRDTGIGIAADHLPHVFEMFSQVAPALERSQGGLGIGLSLVRGLVELHGGSIEAHSGGPGMGSEFIVSLPVVDLPVQAPREQSSEGDESHSGPKCRILVVDDNRDAADSLAMLLRMMGHSLHTAHDGLEAVQAAAMFRPDVVLLDIGLPKMDGYEAARHIRKRPWGKEMFLVALTGWGQEEDKRRALEAGFDQHMTKPVDPAALGEFLATLILEKRM
jgi:PAS domain S-box-containing protein